MMDAPTADLDGFLAQLTSWTGVETTGRRDLLRRRLGERASERGFPSLAAYLADITTPEHDEVSWIISALMLGYSWFFRDPDQLQLGANLLGERLRSAGRASVWIPGCSTGEEVYSLALLAGVGETAGPIETLGSDINRQALQTAQKGRYGRDALRLIPRQFHRRLELGDTSVRMGRELRQAVRFVRHNLITEPPRPQGGAGWDLILCRNVIIHLVPAARGEVLRLLAAALSPHGLLLLSAAEYHDAVASFETIVRDGQHILRPRLGPSPPTPTPAPMPPISARPPAPPVAPAPPPAPEAPELQPLFAAGAMIQRGQVEQAIAILQGLLRAEPLSVHARLVLGVALYVQGRDEEAAAMLRQALFLRPRLWPAAFYLALSLERLGDTVAARDAYRWAERESRHPLPPADERALLDILGLSGWRSELLQAALARLRGDGADDKRVKP